MDNSDWPCVGVLFTSTEFYIQRIFLLHTISFLNVSFSLQLLDFLISSLQVCSMKGIESCFDLFQHNPWPEINDITEQEGKK